MSKTRGTRKDKQVNYELIRKAFLKIIQGKKKAPTIDEVCDATGLSVNTVKKHLKELQFDAPDNPFRILTPEVITAIYETATSGDKGAVQAQKLWMQLIEGWSEKVQQDITSDGEKLMSWTITPVAPTNADK
jgi:DNA-binding transcriptional MocR family regulator